MPDTDKEILTELIERIGIGRLLQMVAEYSIADHAPSLPTLSSDLIDNRDGPLWVEIDGELRPPVD